jgi:DNA-binding IscR family transcriptional regulator
VTSTGSEYFISLIITKAEKEFQGVLANFTIDELLSNTDEQE